VGLHSHSPGLMKRIPATIRGTIGELSPKGECSPVTMIKLKCIAGAGLLLLAAGCTETRVVSSNYDAQLNQFLNQPESSVVANWGDPSVRTKLTTGGDALVFVVLDDSGANACSTVMTSDSSHTIRSYSYAGNGCHTPSRTANVVPVNRVSD